MTYYISQPLISQLGLDPCQFLSSVQPGDFENIVATSVLSSGSLRKLLVLSSMLASPLRYSKAGETPGDFIRRSQRI